jgi:hypothetical protein
MWRKFSTPFFPINSANEWLPTSDSYREGQGIESFSTEKKKHPDWNLPLFSSDECSDGIVKQARTSTKFIIHKFVPFEGHVTCAVRAVPYLKTDSFPPQWPWFEPRSDHAGFLGDKMALTQVFSKRFGFPCQFSFHRLPHTHHHLSSKAGTIGQLVADVTNGLSLTLPH